MYTATPDGAVSTASPPRPLAVIAGEPRCPKCGRLIEGARPRRGWGVGVCVQKRQGARCGQGVMVFESGGVSFVIALTVAELERVRRSPLDAADILAELGALGTALLGAA